MSLRQQLHESNFSQQVRDILVRWSRDNNVVRKRAYVDRRFNREI